MVSWQAFPSLPPRAPPRVSLAPKTPFPIPFKRLPRRLKGLWRAHKVGTFRLEYNQQCHSFAPVHCSNLPVCSHINRLE